jgi:hypothetical protein
MGGLETKKKTATIRRRHYFLIPAKIVFSWLA